MYYGDKVCLRAHKKEDIEKSLDFVNDKELKRYFFTGIPFPMAKWEEEKWIESQVNDNSGKFNFAIEDKETRKYIGSCGIQHVNWISRVATVGILIGDREYRGKGYGTDAMKVMMDFIFNDMNLLKVKLSVYSFNERAIRSYEKCGFKVEGILKNEVFKDGNFYDEIVMGAFKEK